MFLWACLLCLFVTVITVASSAASGATPNAAPNPDHPAQSDSDPLGNAPPPNDTPSLPDPAPTPDSSPPASALPPSDVYVRGNRQTVPANLSQWFGPVLAPDLRALMYCPFGYYSPSSLGWGNQFTQLVNMVHLATLTQRTLVLWESQVRSLPSTGMPELHLSV